MWLTQRTALVACRDARLVRPLKQSCIYAFISNGADVQSVRPYLSTLPFPPFIYMGWSGHGAFWGLLFGGRYFSGASMSTCLSSFQNGSMDEI